MLSTVIAEKLYFQLDEEEFSIAPGIQQQRR